MFPPIVASAAGSRPIPARHFLMSMRLTESERSRLRGEGRRPRSRKQLYRAEALLSLDEGHPVDTVARKFRVGVDRVESWIEGFERLRIGYLAEPSAGRPGRELPPAIDEEDEE